MAAYHDDEWGRPVRSETGLYERLCLEAFQSGLSWRTVLNKRPAFRKAFRDFDVRAVSKFGDADVARLMADAGIVRNRAKILAAITNAQATLELDGALPDVVWSHAPARGSGRATISRRPGDLARVGGVVQGLEEAWLRVRRTHDCVRVDAGVRSGQRSPGELPGVEAVRARLRGRLRSRVATRSSRPARRGSQKCPIGSRQRRPWPVPAQPYGCRRSL